MTMNEEMDCWLCSSKLSEKNKNNWLIADVGNKAICDICYGTHAGTIIRYRNQYSQDAVSIAIAMAQIANIILERLEESKK